MYTKMVSKVGYYSEKILRDMNQYDTLTSPYVWREMTHTHLDQEDKQFLLFLLSDRDVLRARLRAITCWEELKQLSRRLKRLGRVLNHEATGEYWRRFQVMEDWSFLLTEFGDCLEALLELKSTKMPLAEVLKVFVSRI